MTSPALTVNRSTTVKEAAQLMHRHQVKQLPVVDAESGRLIGIVHQSDLVAVVKRPAYVIVQQVRHVDVEAHLTYEVDDTAKFPQLYGRSE